MRNIFSIPKIESPKIQKMAFRKKGDRTLTKADKKKEMKNVKHKCQKCKRTFSDYLLEVHHKKGVSTYKAKKYEPDIPYIEFYTKRRKKASYDRSKNLMILCPICHKKVHKEERDKKKVKKKAKKKFNPLNPKFNFKI